jgi:hypothetical protein
MSRRESGAVASRDVDAPARKPFRAVDVLSGNIDRRAPVEPVRQRKQISAQLEPAQVRLLGELHARLNATARTRIEKSDLVGLGIELLAAALENAGQDLAPEPDGAALPAADGRTREDGPPAFAGADELRAYVRSYVRTYNSRSGSR